MLSYSEHNLNRNKTSDIENQNTGNNDYITNSCKNDQMSISNINRLECSVTTKKYRPDILSSKGTSRNITENGVTKYHKFLDDFNQTKVLSQDNNANYFKHIATRSDSIILHPYKRTNSNTASRLRTHKVFLSREATTTKLSIWDQLSPSEFIARNSSAKFRLTGNNIHRRSVTKSIKCINNLNNTFSSREPRNPISDSTNELNQTLPEINSLMDISRSPYEVNERFCTTGKL